MESPSITIVRLTSEGANAVSGRLKWRMCSVSRVRRAQSMKGFITEADDGGAGAGGREHAPETSKNS